MSTRAVYTFIDKDSGQKYHVYKHHDGYPTGAAGFLQATVPYAWKLPRFEADEFGASFIRANKDAPGGLRLTHDFQDHGDLDYRYEVSTVAKDGKDLADLMVRVFDCAFNDSGPQTYKEIGNVLLSDMATWAAEYEAKQRDEA